MSKKLFLISSYCNDENKLNVLSDNLDILNNLGHDTLLLSPIPIPEEIIKKCTYFFKTKENPVTPISEKTYIFWKNISQNLKLERFYADYGWADLYQRKKLCEIGLTFEYDKYYNIIYDTKINYSIINEINSDKVNRYYSNRATTGDVNEISLHYLPLDRYMTEKLSNYLDKGKYIGSHDMVHQYLMKWVEEESIVKSDLVVEEHVNYYEGEEIFSLVNNGDIKVFLEKDEMNNLTNRFICYDVITKNNRIIINEKIIFNNLNDNEIRDTGLLTREIKKIEIECNGQIYDCTDNYNKIGRNKLVEL